MDDLQRAAPAERTVLGGLIIDGAILIGAGLTSFGTWLIYPPASLVVGGVLLMALGLALAKATR